MKTFTTDKQVIKYLSRRVKALNKERELLREIGGVMLVCIHDEAHGHTADWKTLMGIVEKYEDKYAPLGEEA